MHATSDARFWNRYSRNYAKDVIADQGGYERTLDRTRALLEPDDRVLELGCGTGGTALRLAGDVQSYLATDLSPGMIAIAKEKQSSWDIPALTFKVATAESSMLTIGQYNAVLGFNYLHMVRDMPATLRRIHGLLVPRGLFISKTPCLRDIDPFLSLILLPSMRAIGMAPYVSAFRKTELPKLVSEAGFDILASENHATKGNDWRPWIVARKRCAFDAGALSEP